jgi:hypothetical protein
MKENKHEPLRSEFSGLCFMNILWNLALSWVVSGGKGVGGGDLGNDIPVFC